MNTSSLCAWQKNLPHARGEIRVNEPLAARTWFNVGGPADVLFRPSDRTDLQDFLAALGEEIPVMVIGAASNLLVRDGGVRGVVVILGKAFEAITVSGTDIIAGAAAPDVKVASAAGRAELTGLEFLRGVPGTIGGAVAMNAGAFGGQISDVLTEAVIIARSGKIETRDALDLGFDYRASSIDTCDIVVEATFRAEAGDATVIRKRMQEIARERADAQPVDTRTGGSTFKNPKAAAAHGKRAWELIEEAGCRSLSIGGAKVSDKHCNFIENTGQASAAEIESLIEEVRARVAAKTDILLEPEIRFVGEAQV